MKYHTTNIKDSDFSRMTCFQEPSENKELLVLWPNFARRNHENIVGSYAKELCFLFLESAKIMVVLAQFRVHAKRDFTAFDGARIYGRGKLIN